VEIHVHPVAAHPVRVGHGGRTIPARAQQRRQKLLPELTRELRLILARVDSGLELGQELNKASVMLAVDEFTDTCVILQQLIQQGGGAMKSLLALKQLLDDRRLTRLQEYISKMSAKMSVVMMLFLFPALLIVLAGPGFTAITRAFATDVGSWTLMKALIVVASLLMLGGCATDGQAPWSAMLAPSSCGKLDSEQELALNLADDLANDGKLHASLANLQKPAGQPGRGALAQGQGLPLLRRNEAEPLYRGLLGTCLTADAEHGLGQIYAARGDNGQAQAHLQRAVRLAPQ
jgi:tetratricopeptide (TPR) repeat protein